MIAILAVVVVVVSVRSSTPLSSLLPKPHRRLPRCSARPRPSVRPSVFLSETSALILVVEIGFLRHRSRGRGRQQDGRRRGRRRRRREKAARRKRDPVPERDRHHGRGRGLTFYQTEPSRGICLSSAPPSFLPRHAYTKQVGFCVSQKVGHG